MAHHHSYSLTCVRFWLVVLCVSMIVIQLTQALNEDIISSSSIENDNDHPLYRRDSKKVAHMLQKMLQRGEMQVRPNRIRAYLHRLHRREATD